MTFPSCLKQILPMDMSRPSRSSTLNHLLSPAFQKLGKKKKKKTPIQTYAFIDLETSGTNGTKITEFAVIAVSRYDLEEMQTRIRTSIPIQQPRKRAENTSSVHVKSDSICENRAPQDENIRLSERVKRRLFAAASHDESDSSMERNIQVEDKLNGQQSNERPQNQEQEMTPSRATVDVATDTVGLIHRRCNSHYYKVPELPRRMTKLTQLFNPKKLMYPETEDVSGLNNIGLEYYPVLSDGFCNAFKELIFNLPKPVCLVAHNGEKYDFPIIVSEFLHATNSQFDWGDVVYADTLEVFRLLDKIETHLEIQEVQLQTDKHLNWFLDDSVFAVPNPPPRKRRRAGRQPHHDGSASSNGVNNMVDSDCSEIVDPQPGACTGNAPCTPRRPTTSDAVEVNACQLTPKPMVMPSPERPCPETPVTPSSNIGSGIGSIRNPVPSLCGSLFTPPQSPVATTSAVSGSSSNQHRAPPSASKSTPLHFPPNCSFKSMVKITMSHKEYNVGFSKYSRPFSQPNIYQRFFGRKYAAHRAEADCQALLQLTGHYGLLFTKTVDIMKRPMAEIAPKMLTTRIVENLKSEKDEE